MRENISLISTCALHSIALPKCAAIEVRNIAALYACTASLARFCMDRYARTRKERRRAFRGKPLRLRIQMEKKKKKLVACVERERERERKQGNERARGSAQTCKKTDSHPRQTAYALEMVTTTSTIDRIILFFSLTTVALNLCLLGQDWAKLQFCQSVFFVRPTVSIFLRLTSTQSATVCRIDVGVYAFGSQSLQVILRTRDRHII